MSLQAGRTFRVFVSSTFEDLKAERNKLHEAVFPRLRALCQKHGARFQAIDLRWGVSEEASLDQQTMNICLGEIARCLETTPGPNFIVLLGQRYGWCPPPPQIPADEFRQLLRSIPAPSDRRFLRKWYRRDKNAVPSEYRLLPREPGGEYEGYEAWQPVEARLHDILAAVAQEMDLDEERRRVYVASATEQEIAAGALRVPEPEGKVFCFLRTIEGVTDQRGKLLEGADRFIDADQDSLDALRGELHEKLERRPDAVHAYRAEWNEENQQPTPAHLDSLAEEAYRALAGAIEAELEHPTERPPAPEEEVHVERDDGMDAEGRAHCDFANRLLHFFVGCREPLREISEYLESGERRLLAVVAEGGAGKSALMARAVEQAKSEQPQAQIVYRFIGATPGSSDGRTLLRSLCQELSRRYGADEEVPDDYRELVPEFGKQLAFATSERPLILFLDALDQLSEAHGARGLTWLPDTLPEHVRLIVSARRQAETFDALKGKRPEQVGLGPMSGGDGEALLDLWLDDAHRTLQPPQREEVLGKFELSEGRPLYLKLAFEEARRWASSNPQRVLEPKIPGIIRKNLLDRLVCEERHGEMLVSRALGYLAASRYGLAEDELLDVLSRDPKLYGSFFRSTYHLPPDLLAQAKQYRQSHETSGVEQDAKGRQDHARTSEQWLALLRSDEAKEAELESFFAEVLPKPDGPRLPVVLWSRLYFDLEPYLTERFEEGGVLLGFYHREFDEVVTEAYLGDGEGNASHGRLADYFRSKADPGEEGNWQGGYPRGLGELPYHLTWAGRAEDFRNTLTEFNFLYAKVAALGPQPLIADYDEARRAGFRDESLELVQDALRLSAYVVGPDPVQLAGQLVGRLPSSGDATVTRLLQQAQDWRAAAWLRPLFPTLTQSAGPLLRTLEGHTGDVTAVAVTPDGRYAISGSWDKTLRVWDLARGEAVHTLKGHRDLVYAVAVTPDGRHVVSGSADKTLKVWDLVRGEAVHTLRGHEGKVRAVAVTSDGRYAISGSRDETLRVWDLARGEAVHTLEGHTSPVEAVAVTPDGRHAVSGSWDGRLKVWDLERGHAFRTLSGHTGTIDAVAVTPDGRHVVSGSQDKTLKVWDLARGEAVRTLKGHTNMIDAVAVTPDGRHAVSGSWDGTVKVWDLERGEALRTLEGHCNEVEAVAVTPDGRHVVSGSQDRTLKVWDLEREAVPRTQQGHSGWVTAVAVTPDGRHVVSGSQDKTLKVWDLARGEAVRTLKGHTAGVWNVAVTPDGRHVVSGSDKAFKVWDLARGEAVRTVEGHTNKLDAVAVTPDGRYVVSGSWDGTLKVWDLERGEALRTVKGKRGAFGAVAVTPEGMRAVLRNGHKLSVWDLERGEEVRALGEGRSEDWVNAVAVTPDGHAVAGHLSGTLRVWDLELGEALWILEGHTETVNCVAVTPDGRYAVSASADNTLRVWGLTDGRLVAVFHGEGRLPACAVGPDGRTIVAGERSGRVHFLRLEGVGPPPEGVT